MKSTEANAQAAVARIVAGRDELKSQIQVRAFPRARGGHLILFLHTHTVQHFIHPFKSPALQALTDRAARAAAAEQKAVADAQRLSAERAKQADEVATARSALQVYGVLSFSLLCVCWVPSCGCL